MEEPGSSGSRRSKPPPERVGHRTIQCLRPIMRSRHLLLVATLAIPQAIAYASSVEILPTPTDVAMEAADSVAPSAEAPDIMHIKARPWTKTSGSKQNHSLTLDNDTGVAATIIAGAHEVGVSTASTMAQGYTDVAASHTYTTVTDKQSDVVPWKSQLHSDSTDRRRRTNEVSAERKHRTTFWPKARSQTTLTPSSSPLALTVSAMAQSDPYTTVKPSSTPIALDVSAEIAELAALPPREVEFLGHSAQPQRSKALGYIPHVLAVLASIIVVATAVVPRVFYSQCCLWFRKGAVYQALELEDPEAPSVHDEVQPSGLRRFFPMHNHGQTPEHHSEEVESRRFSRRHHLLHQGTPPLTESEPEGELEPLISDEPRGLEPVPSMLGMPDESNSPGQSNMFLAQCSRRVVLMYSSPLCYMSQAQRPNPLPQIPFEREWDVIVRARDEANGALRMTDQGHGRLSRRRSTAALEAQPLTAASLRRLVAPSPDPACGHAAVAAAAVLHLSAHGIQDCLVAENGKTTAHFLSCSTLREMMAGSSGSSAAPVRLVVLNACSLRMLGDQFVNSGVAHVICSSAELRDSASHVFLCALYSSLFQGGTVKHAFTSALVALRSDPEASTRGAADFFCLLPDQAPHDEVLFWPATSVSTSVRPPSSSSFASECAPIPPLCKRESSGTSSRTSSICIETDISEGPHSHIVCAPNPSTCKRQSSGASASTHAGTDNSNSSSFLTTDNGESSADGVDESCGSEGHADTSSANGSTSRDSDSDGSASENTRLLPNLENVGTAEMADPDQVLVTQVPAARRARVASGSRVCSTVVKTRAFGCARRPVRQEVMVPRKLPPHRGAASLVTLPPESVLSPFARAVPPVPEDFIGRSVDVWYVLQHLGERRAVVVCGEPGTDHGIGKSAVLDAVHRAFSLQMGGVCVPVHLRALSDADVVSTASAVGWIDKVKARVQSVLEEYQDLYHRVESTGARPVATALSQRSRSSSSSSSCLRNSVLGNGAQALRRRKPPARVCQRSVSRGFHLLSDPLLVESAVEELVAAMASLKQLCQECSRECSSPASSTAQASGVRILLVLDECDHLIQQRHFQDAIADVLRHCASYSIVLSTQQPMVETGGGWFKVVHQSVGGLAPKDAARLFLRRAHRPLYWDELLDPMVSLAAADNATHMGAGFQTEVSASSGPPASTSSSAAVGGTRTAVVMTAKNEAEILARVSAHPAVAAQRGNPRRLIELASQVRPSLASLWELSALGNRGPCEEV